MMNFTDFKTLYQLRLEKRPDIEIKDDEDFDDKWILNLKNMCIKHKDDVENYDYFGDMKKKKLRKIIDKVRRLLENCIIGSRYEYHKFFNREELYYFHKYVCELSYHTRMFSMICGYKKGYNRVDSEDDYENVKRVVIDCRHEWI